MSFESPDRVRYGEQIWGTSGYPLQEYLRQRGVRFPGIWPTLFRGYDAIWRIDARKLWLDSLWPDGDARISQLFPGQQLPVFASWYSGHLHLVRGAGPRATGHPPQQFYDDQAILLIELGEVRHEWVIDLHHVPDETDDEIRLNFPAFLWPERLRSPGE